MNSAWGDRILLINNNVRSTKTGSRWSDNPFCPQNTHMSYFPDASHENLLFSATPANSAISCII